MATPHPALPGLEERSNVEQRQWEKEQQAHTEQQQREKNVLWAFWSALGAGLTSLLVFSAAVNYEASGWAAMWKIFALGVLVAGAASLIGALLGFLFGLPRGNDEGRTTSIASASAAPVTSGQDVGIVPSVPPAPTGGRRFGYVNNNLLEISDWLTKIIVGAGLVGLKDLIVWISEVAQTIGDGSGLEGSLARVFGGSVITYFFGWGFLFVYIQTRTIISFIFASMERSLQNIGVTIREAVAIEVREKVMPQIASTVSEGTILQLLYSSEPGAAGAVVERAREFLGRSENESNAQVWLYLACAFGQQHAAARDETIKNDLADKAYNALKRALEINPSLRNVARGLMYTDDPLHLPGDDDLATLRGEARFQELVRPPTI